MKLNAQLRDPMARDKLRTRSSPLQCMDSDRGKLLDPFFSCGWLVALPRCNLMVSLSSGRRLLRKKGVGVFCGCAELCIMKNVLVTVILSMDVRVEER